MNATYSYAEALERLALLGFGLDAQKSKTTIPRSDEPLNDWLFAREIPELAAWFGENPLPDRVFD